MERKSIQAISDEDFVKFLAANGLTECYNNGDILCAVCSKQITEHNIFLITRTKERWVFICDESSCITQTVERS